MKKSKAIELLKAQTHSIKMDRREERDVQLLNEILKEACPEDETTPSGNGNFYFIEKTKYRDWAYTIELNPCSNHINISEIEVDDEFVNGEEVEGSDDGIHWTDSHYYIGKSKDSRFACQDKIGFIFTFDHIRKSPPTERAKAIQTIKELKEKFNIKNEEV
jgi:hypothetical protein